MGSTIRVIFDVMQLTSQPKHMGREKKKYSISFFGYYIEINITHLFDSTPRNGCRRVAGRNEGGGISVKRTRVFGVANSARRALDIISKCARSKKLKLPIE